MNADLARRIALFLNKNEKAIIRKYEFLCERNKSKIPYTTDKNGNYNDFDYISDDLDFGINWWTNGFFTGILLQMYKVTGDDKYIAYAREQEEKLDKCFEQFEGIHHDAGFMWLLSAAMDYKETGNKEAKIRAMHAATILAGRFNPNGDFIRAWNGLAGRDLNSVIVDSLMNMSLLYWAYEVSGDPRFVAVAKKHTDNLVNHIIREDGSVRHIIKFDPVTGEYLGSLSGQGMAHGSCWSRGQAWAIYGFTNAYKHTENKNYLDCAKRAADYFISHVREDYMVPVDFHQPEKEFYTDNSALCIAVSGLLDLAELTGIEEYKEKAVSLLEGVLKTGCCLDESTEAVVLGCNVSYQEREDGAHTLIYADYFFLEAFLKLGHKALIIW